MLVAYVLRVDLYSELLMERQESVSASSLIMSRALNSTMSNPPKAGMYLMLSESRSLVGLIVFHRLLTSYWKNIRSHQRAPNNTLVEISGWYHGLHELAKTYAARRFGSQHIKVHPREVLSNRIIARRQSRGFSLSQPGLTHQKPQQMHKTILRSCTLLLCYAGCFIASCNSQAFTNNSAQGSWSVLIWIRSLVLMRSSGNVLDLNGSSRIDHAMLRYHKPEVHRKRDLLLNKFERYISRFGQLVLDQFVCANLHENLLQPDRFFSVTLQPGTDPSE